MCVCMWRMETEGEMRLDIPAYEGKKKDGGVKVCLSLEAACQTLMDGSYKLCC